MSRLFLPLWALVLTACQVSVPDPSCQPGPKEQSDWAQATKANNPAAYRKYLATYPTGCYASNAAMRLKTPVTKTQIAGLANDRTDKGNTPVRY